MYSLYAQKRSQNHFIGQEVATIKWYDEGQHGIKTVGVIINAKILVSIVYYCRSLEIQLPGTLFFAIFEWFPFTKLPFKTGQDNRNSETALWDW